jgi:PIN domain nuclease of toxin-antitoxin system
VTILDSFAIIALLRGEPADAEVRRLIEAGNCALTTLGMAEVIDHLVRVVGTTDEEAVLDVAQLGLGPPVELDDASATQAALLRSRHYNRRTRAVSLCDCVAAHAARSTDSAVATADPHLLELCRDEGISFIPLPDSNGLLWSGS